MGKGDTYELIGAYSFLGKESIFRGFVLDTGERGLFGD